ncbi:MAG: mechanosensitive ion channel family protein [Chloroflexi bacterium]|nr:mechanosensitive ion channel family protein [Chloroflexota bacterium]
MDWLDRSLWGNTLGTWLLSLAVGLTVFLALSLLKRVFFHRLARIAKRTKTDADDLALQLLSQNWLLLFAAISLGAAYLIPAWPDGQSVLRLALLALILTQVGMVGSGLIRYAVSRRIKVGSESPDTDVRPTIQALGLIGRIVLWAIVVLLFLDSIPGIEVNTLLAGLGIGGIATALAVQAVLGELLASVSILLDKPFVVGDFITVGDYGGTVEYIGLRSTRFRSVMGEQVVFSNTDLVASRIQNFKRMQDRRVTFNVRVPYGTSYDQLLIIPELLREIVEAQQQTEFAWARFADFEDSTLNFEVVYKMVVADYNAYIAVRQAINYEIVRQFSENGIELAYPTQRVHLNGRPPSRSRGAERTAGAGTASL